MQLTDEIKKQMGEQCKKLGELSRWMSQNFDAIFATAPKNALYAVGIHPEQTSEQPEIHYFREKYGSNGAIAFRIEQSNIGKTTDWRYKH
jgi:hypothetical protein